MYQFLFYVKLMFVKKIDKVIIDVSMKYEVKLDIRNKLEKRCPRLRSFLSFLKLVSRNGSGKTTSH